ncbi:DUF3265 domain-containing protein [Vibrio navarrensis]|uniref:DUF3265 domain-containing protein n=1 Tax=Vibrio navarrensis TaxID=29495 RepID=A0AAJ4LVV0_9VIBR|nr:DUF3265 domain-containing protein [Vibrio navarrensis]
MTNGSRGTANAWHFYHALVFVVTVLCGSLAMALAAQGSRMLLTHLFIEFRDKIFRNRLN